MVKDIVCGMMVDDENDRTASRVYKGRRFFFCSPECMLIFVGETDFFVSQLREKRVKVKDPACGMLVDKESPPFLVSYRNMTYYLCSSACKSEFELHATKYIQLQREA